MNLITLFLTCANQAEADKIAAKLLDDKLIACVRQIQVSSDYWWKAKKEHSEEVQLIMESSEDKFESIEKAIGQLHSYETFVLTAYPISKASQGVEQWVKESVN